MSEAGLNILPTLELPVAWKRKAPGMYEGRRRQRRVGREGTVPANAILTVLTACPHVHVLSVFSRNIILLPMETFKLQMMYAWTYRQTEPQ